MKLDEFMRKTPPKAKRSRLEPFKTEIQTLKNCGYAVHQIQEWLATEGLHVTPSAVQQYIARYLRTTGSTSAPDVAPKAVATTADETERVEAAWQTPSVSPARQKSGFEASRWSDSRNDPNSYTTANLDALKDHISGIEEKRKAALKGKTPAALTSINRNLNALKDRLAKLQKETTS